MVNSLVLCANHSYSLILMQIIPASQPFCSFFPMLIVLILFKILLIIPTCVCRISLHKWVIGNVTHCLQLNPAFPTFYVIPTIYLKDPFLAPFCRKHLATWLCWASARCTKSLLILSAVYLSSNCVWPKFCIRTSY